MVIHVKSDHQISCNWFNEPFTASPYKNLYWDMHGLIFEASIWLLAGSTRYAHVHREAQLCCVARSAHQTVSRYSYWHFDLALQRKTPRIVLELSGLATNRPSTGTHSLGWLEPFRLTRVPHTRPRPHTHSMALLWWEPPGERGGWGRGTVGENRSICPCPSQSWPKPCCRRDCYTGDNKAASARPHAQAPSCPPPGCRTAARVGARAARVLLAAPPKPAMKSTSCRPVDALEVFGTVAARISKAASLSPWRKSCKLWMGRYVCVRIRV